MTSAKWVGKWSWAGNYSGGFIKTTTRREMGCCSVEWEYFYPLSWLSKCELCYFRYSEDFSIN